MGKMAGPKSYLRTEMARLGALKNEHDKGTKENYGVFDLR